MNHDTRLRFRPIAPMLALLLAAGSVVSVAAQPERPARDNPGQTNRERNNDRDRQLQNHRQTKDRQENPRGTEEALRGVDLRSADWLTDREVYNTNNDHIADVDDLIINRGTGRIEHAVLKTGTVLGMGGTSIAVPYGALLRWDVGNERFILGATADQLKSYPEFSTDTWTGMLEAAEKQRDESVTLRDRFLAEWGDTIDPYADNIRHAERTNIEGEVVRVERSETRGGEYVVLTIKQDDDSIRRVALAPSWYVTGSTYVPYRGERVKVDAYSAQRNHDEPLVARSVRFNDREFTYRSPEGDPMWRENTLRWEDKSYAMPYWRSLLVSSLDGMKVFCRNVECGTIDDVIVDRRTGQVVLVSIDPDDNFLGIADTKRLVPWSISSVAVDGTLRVDASKEMVLASPVTPSDLTTLNGDALKMAFKAYDAPYPDLRPQTVTTRRDGYWPENNNDQAVKHDGWHKDGAIVTAMRSGSTQRLTGEVAEIREISFNDGTGAATAITLKGQNADRPILLGPAHYMKNQEGECYKKGADVAVDAVPVTIDGKSYLVAKSIRIEGEDEVKLIDARNHPLWDGRE